MFNSLSFVQKRIVVCTESRIIVKACPGSGKTFSVTARLARLLNSNNLYKHQGIAVLSFTNTACEEIRKGLKENFNIENVDYPHFIGTIDKFINNFIFLPYGHIPMECNSRPEIVGTEYNKWFEFDSSLTKYFNKKNKRNNTSNLTVSKRDPNYYFDKVSFSADYKLIPIVPLSNFHFGKEKWASQNNKKVHKFIKDIILSKEFHFKQGVANQSDVNYFANKILNDYHLITKNLVNRFPIIIIDEAQDTTELQMSIIETLINAGLKNIMLVGDPDQAIFEWNTANADLFNKKWDDKTWHNIHLNENRRSSTNICNTLNCFFKGNMTSVSKDKDFDLFTEIHGHKIEKKSIVAIKDNFLKKCKELNIHQNELAIVYRGKKFGEDFFGKIDEENYKENLPWKSKNNFVRDIVQGKYLIEQGKLKDGLRLMERGYHKLNNQQLRFISNNFIKEQIETIGFRKYRNELFNFINELPIISGKELKDWITQVNSSNGLNLTVESSKAKVQISSLFHESKVDENELFINTIHSVKGKSLDAILVFLNKMDNSNYENIINKDFDTLKSADKEQLRIVYVACSRPRKLLWLAVPESDLNSWNEFLPSQKRENSTYKQLKLVF